MAFALVRGHRDGDSIRAPPGIVVINQFQGAYRFLSNFWSATVILDGVEYPTVEHAYQASKFYVSVIRQGIAKAPTPGDAKRLGRQTTVGRQPGWELDRLPVMLHLLRQKFAPGSILALRLLATNSEELVEGNTWGDVFWGQDLYTGKGENNLGRLLMKIREELKGT